MRISDWSSDVCSSDLAHALAAVGNGLGQAVRQRKRLLARVDHDEIVAETVHLDEGATAHGGVICWTGRPVHKSLGWRRSPSFRQRAVRGEGGVRVARPGLAGGGPGIGPSHWGTAGSESHLLCRA